MNAARFRPGNVSLLSSFHHRLAGRRVGLLSHPAALAPDGASTAALLRAAPGLRLAALFGPEHGFFGSALAGAPVLTRWHPAWKIPVHSLYGAFRRPTPRMLKDLDTLVVDLQDLGARPYTYVSSLRYFLEAADALDKPVIVADRPIPLPCVVDGPMRDAAFESFVALIPAPMHYGLTPGEAARWLARKLGLRLDLRVAPMRGYARQAGREAGWPPWVPPSPGIESWHSGQTYTATVFTEAFPGLDHGRGTGLAFQVIGAPWLKARALCERLTETRLPGVRFHEHPYVAQSAAFKGAMLKGVRLSVTDPRRFRPVTTSVHLLTALHALHGERRLWRAADARPDFFDKLYATDAVRRQLLDRVAPALICRMWDRPAAAYRAERDAALLYADREER